MLCISHVNIVLLMKALQSWFRAVHPSPEESLFCLAMNIPDGLSIVEPLLTHILPFQEKGRE